MVSATVLAMVSIRPPGGAGNDVADRPLQVAVGIRGQGLGQAERGQGCGK